MVSDIWSSISEATVRYAKWSLLRQLSRLSINSLGANLTSKPPPSSQVGFNIQVILQDGVRHKDPWVAGYLEDFLNANTCVASYSTFDKTSFAYISARDRWPVILVSSRIASTSLSADLQETDSRNWWCSPCYDGHERSGNGEGGKANNCRFGKAQVWATAWPANNVSPCLNPSRKEADNFIALYLMMDIQT